MVQLVQQNLNEVEMGEALGETMEAILAERFAPEPGLAGLSKSASRPRPRFEGKTRTKGDRRRLLIRVQACALAPGDARVMRGDCDLFQKPPSFPWVPGSDVCGVVESVESPDAADDPFKPGDWVVATFEKPKPNGGLAQFFMSERRHCWHKPKNLDACQAAALGSSGLTAFTAANQTPTNKRVLVLGASGGVGLMLVQLLKSERAASYIACVSKTADQARMDELLGKGVVDRVVDYTKEDFSKVAEWRENKFDVVWDLAGTHDAWSKSLKVLKKSGVFNGWSVSPIIHNYLDAALFMVPMLYRTLKTKLLPGFYPRRPLASGMDDSHANRVAFFKLVEAGNLRVILDPACPLPFTVEGAQRGLELQQSRHALGKVVVQIATADTSDAPRSADSSTAAKGDLVGEER